VRLERDSLMGYDIFLPDTTAVERYAGLEVSVKAKGFVVHVDALGLAEGASSQILSWQGLQLALTRQSGLLSLWAWMDEQNDWQLVVEQLPESFQGKHRFFQLCAVHFPTLEGPEQFVLAVDGRPVSLERSIKSQASARILKLFDETKGSIRFARFKELSEYPKSLVRYDPSLRARYQFETGEKHEPAAPRLNPYRDVSDGSMAFRLQISSGDLSYDEEAHLMSHTVDRELWKLDQPVRSLNALRKFIAKTESDVGDILPGFWAKDWEEPWEDRNFDDQYAQRLTAYLRPEVSGDYVFWLEADDAAEVMISAPDDFETWSGLVTTEQKRQNLVRINQPELFRSELVYLEAGRLYLLEALHYETAGDDFFSLSWTPPGSLQDGPTERIPAQVLSAPSTGQPDTMPRWLYPAGEDFLPDVSEILQGKQVRSANKQARSSDPYISAGQEITANDFDATTGKANHQVLGSINGYYFPWIQWGSVWLYYYTGSRQVFKRADNDESFRIFGNGSLFYYPYFTPLGSDPGAPEVSVGGATVPYGESRKLSAPSHKYSMSYQWLRDGATLVWNSSATSYTISSMTSGDAGGYLVKISNPSGTVPSASRAIYFAKANQSAVNITSVPSSLGYDAKDTLSASGGDAGAYSFEVHEDDSAKGSIVNTNQVEALASSGTVRVRAVRAGNSNYNSQASDWDTITLTRGEQAAVTVSAPSSLAYGQKGTLSASGGTRGDYSFEVHEDDSAKGSIVNTNQVEALASSGTVRVRAVRAGDSDYNPQESDWYSIALTAPQTPKPSITSSGSANTTEGQPFNYTITATNSPTSYSASGLPSWLGRSGAVISGTVPASASSSSPVQFSVRASNASGWGSYKTVTLTIVDTFADSDSDGLDDTWEITHYGSTTFAGWSQLASNDSSDDDFFYSLIEGLGAANNSSFDTSSSSSSWFSNGTINAALPSGSDLLLITPEPTMISVDTSDYVGSTVSF